MANFLASAATWLHGQRHSNMSSSVTYTRFGGAPQTMAATIGRTDAERLGESELVTTAGVRDYIFRTIDFLVDGVFVPPDRMDSIAEADGATWEVVEVAGEPVWRYSDEYRNAIRVHTARRDL